MARPKSNNPKKYRLELRLTKEELETIQYVAKALDTDKSKAIMQTMEERADEIYRIQIERKKLINTSENR